MHQQIIDANNGELKSKNKSILVGYNYTTKESQKITKNWENSIVKFERK